MNTATINRDYLSKIFATMNLTDTTWAIKTLTERLYLFGLAAEAKAPAQKSEAWQRPLPEAVLKMTMKHRKRVSYETAEDYRDDLTNILEEKYR